VTAKPWDSYDLLFLEPDEAKEKDNSSGSFRNKSRCPRQTDDEKVVPAGSVTNFLINPAGYKRLSVCLEESFGPSQQTIVLGPA